MIVNGYAVLDGFLSLLRLGLGVVVLWLGVGVWRGWRAQLPGEGRRQALEDKCYLLFLLAGLLLVLNIASWPVFYLLLQSYVPEWPGVMCIYGVTQIGTGSYGLSRWLPTLVTTLEVTKPALIFVSGAWFVLYLVNRQTRTAPLTGRVLSLLLMAGLLAVADAAAEQAYLGIPKKEEIPPEGCCTAVFDSQTRASRFLPPVLTEPQTVPWLYAAYYALNIGIALLLVLSWRVWGRQFPGGLLAVLFALAVLSLVVNAVFLVEVAAPHLIRLPFHHCPYDLVPKAPESLVAVALFFTGLFAVGWGCLVGWLAKHSEARPLVPGMIGQLFRLGVLGYLWSVLMVSLELVLYRWS
jgi:hypothetical protein